MGRERRNTPLPEYLPSVPEAKPQKKEFDLGDQESLSVEAPTVPKHRTARGRRRPPTEKLVSTELARSESGEVEAKIEDLTHLAISEDEPKVEVRPQKRAKRKTIKPMALPTPESADAGPKISEDEIAKAVEAHPEYRPIPAFKETEEAWFKQGEDESYVKNLAEKQQIADRQKESEVRASLKETYDQGAHDTIIDTDEEVEAAAKQAEAMVASGELDPKLFKTTDYRYLLIEKARIDRELETAGWWQARKLRAELKYTQKELGDYEEQLNGAGSERVGRRDPDAMTVKEKAAVKAEKKPGFFARLFGKK